MQPLIAVFAKAPVAGKVKTRLVPPLTAEQAAKLYERLVADVWRRLAMLRDAVEVELHTDTGTGAWPGMAPRKLQVEGDLGERMLHVLKGGLAAGRPVVGIIGGDIPDVPLEAVRSLMGTAADVALGPARDGGYYMIACRRTDADMFAGVRWSTQNALADTVGAASRCGLSVQVGPAWHDVDTAEDLELLPLELRP